MAISEGELPRIPVTASFDLSDLPGNTLVTGAAYKDGGLDSRQEQNSPTTVLSFNNEPVASVIEALKKKKFDYVRLTTAPHLP